MKYRGITFGLCITLVAMILALVGPAFGQTPEEHAKHHPAPGGAGPAPASPAAPAGMPMPPGGNQAAPAGAGGMTGNPPEAAPRGGVGAGMGAGMGDMMKQMGVPPRKEVYPSLMALPDEVTPEQRAGIEQLAQERMKSGAARMSSGLEKLNNSTSGEDYAAMQQATGQMREGLAEFEAGIAARRVLYEGKAPRNLALDWFKREMNLASPIRPEGHRALLGVTPFHLFTMVLLIAFALAMVAMYFFKMRRAAALCGRLDPDDTKPPPPGASPPLAGGPAPVAPAAGNPAAADKSAEAPPAAPVPGEDASNAADKPPAPPPAGNSPASPATPPVAPDGGDAAKIADRADELWQARGRPMGSPKVDWLRAEAELAKAADKPPAPPPSGGSPASPAAPPAVSEAPQRRL